jgi:hypothetical protein
MGYGFVIKPSGKSTNEGRRKNTGYATNTNTARIAAVSTPCGVPSIGADALAPFISMYRQREKSGVVSEKKICRKALAHKNTLGGESHQRPRIIESRLAPS